jgi:hypothetical protein
MINFRVCLAKDSSDSFGGVTFLVELKPFHKTFGKTGSRKWLHVQLLAWSCLILYCLVGLPLVEPVLEPVLKPCITGA